MNPTPERFTLGLVGRAHADLERLTVRAEQLGLNTLLLEVLRQVAENLEIRPREWGDPYINFRALEAVGYGRAVFPARIRIEYAVHNTGPLVWLSALIPLPDSPFAGS